MNWKLSAAAIASLLAFAFGASANAGTKDDIRDLQARLAQVEAALSAQPGASVRIGELEQQIQILTGRIEEMAFQIDQQGRRIEAMSAALAGDALGAAAFGADDLSGGYAGPAARGPVDLSTGDPIADQIERADPSPQPAVNVELPLNPDAAYDYASSFLLSGDYQRAKAAFKLYAEAFPNHPQTPDAKFRLGEIHLALQENTDAADIFLGHIRQYPNDRRAPEAHLKLGTAFARLEKPEQACTIFKTLKSKFPDAPQPVLQRANIEMARIDCS